jgi:phosphate:Na+ symporter
MPDNEPIPLFLAGMVFFLLGLDAIKTELRGLASRSVRDRARAAVASPLRAAVVGMGFGAVSQSATAVSMVLSGLISAGLVPMRRALSIVAWANPGTSVITFLAAINLSAATLWLIGLVGLLMRHKRLLRARAALGAVLGIGLMLFGLIQLKRAAAPLPEADWFHGVSSFLNASLVVAFGVGALLRVGIQSSSGIAVILIALCGRDVLAANNALMVVHGTSLGIGVSVLLMGRGFRGEALRIAYYQALVNLLSGAFLALWLIAASLTGLPSLLDLSAALQLNTETSLATGYLVQMLLCPVFGFLVRNRIEPFLERLAPESAEHALARPRYLTGSDLDEPEIAIDLVAKEQLRMLEAMPALLDAGRSDMGASTGLDRDALLPSLRELHTEISGFLSEILGRSHDAELTTAFLTASERQQALGELATNVDSLARTVTTIEADSPARMLGGLLVESADMMLHTAVDAFRDDDPLDREMLAHVTADRGEQMESIRTRTARTESGSALDQAQILYAASLFERTAYLVRRATVAAGSPRATGS